MQIGQFKANYQGSQEMLWWFHHPNWYCPLRMLPPPCGHNTVYLAWTIQTEAMADCTNSYTSYKQYFGVCCDICILLPKTNVGCHWKGLEYSYITVDEKNMTILLLFDFVIYNGRFKTSNDDLSWQRGGSCDFYKIKLLGAENILK